MKKCVSIPQHNEQRKTKSAYICCVHSHPYKLSTLKFLDTNERRRALVFERVTLYAICKGFRARQRGLFGPVMLLYMSLDALRSISSDNIVGSHNQNSAVWKKKMEFETSEIFFCPSIGRTMKAMAVSNDESDGSVSLLCYINHMVIFTQFVFD